MKTSPLFVMGDFFLVPLRGDKITVGYTKAHIPSLRHVLLCYNRSHLYVEAIDETKRDVQGVFPERQETLRAHHPKVVKREGT
jgi:hypothetical protein